MLGVLAAAFNHYVFSSQFTGEIQESEVVWVKKSEVGGEVSGERLQLEEHHVVRLMEPSCTVWTDDAEFASELRSNRRLLEGESR